VGKTLEHDRELDLSHQVRDTDRDTGERHCNLCLEQSWSWSDEIKKDAMGRMCSMYSESGKQFKFQNVYEMKRIINFRLE
jgi:hypothetical protein